MSKTKLTDKNVLKVVKTYTQQNDKNVAFGFVGNIDTADFYSFINGSGENLVASICSQMALNQNFKELLMASVYMFSKIEKTGIYKELLNNTKETKV